MQTLKEYALDYHSKFNLNLIPVDIQKKPTAKSWKKWQTVSQDIKSIDSINWNHTTKGIGGVNSPTSFVSLDFDNCSDIGFVKHLIEELGIKSWIVQTGRGLHCHFNGLDEPELIFEIFGDNGVIFFTPKDEYKNFLDHLELRLKDCYTILPPSLHQSMKEYSFLDEFPQTLPDKLKANELIKILFKYFELSVPDKSNNAEKLNGDIFNLIANGADRGFRHETLKQIFGALYEREISKKFILSFILVWNKNCRPPESEDLIEKQVNDLWSRYSKGLDNKFLTFPHCLLSLPGADKTIIEKIICYSTKEYDEHKEIIEELDISNLQGDYHKQSKDYISKYEARYGTSYILRIGLKLLKDTYEGKVKYYIFSVYCGAESFLGRNRQKPIKQIAISRLAYLALGYKKEVDYIRSDSEKKPLSRYKIIKAIEYLEKYGFFGSCSLVKGKMRYFSTFIKNKAKLMEIVEKRETNKLEKKIEVEKLREEYINNLNLKRLELKRLKCEQYRKKKRIV